jgi:hypothetical protein
LAQSRQTSYSIEIILGSSTAPQAEKNLAGALNNEDKCVFGAPYFFNDLARLITGHTTALTYQHESR